jgi:hypothetical protein
MAVLVSTTLPLRIDSDLVNQARSAGAMFDRPPTAQIEHWAKLGRVLDAILSGASTLRIKQAGRVADIGRVVALSQTEKGRKKARTLIFKHGGPVYEADTEASGLIVERRPDGSSRKGRFVNRKFVAVAE